MPAKHCWGCWLAAASCPLLRGRPALLRASLPPTPGTSAPVACLARPSQALDCTHQRPSLKPMCRQVRGMWTMLLLEPFHLSSFGARVTALCYGFLATILVNTCEPGRGFAREVWLCCCFGRARAPLPLPHVSKSPGPACRPAPADCANLAAALTVTSINSQIRSVAVSRSPCGSHHQ